MTVEFKLPDLGEGIAEGEIVKWLVSEGQDIKEDQPMVEVMTDKATVQIPSPTTGKVRQILAKEGETIKVGTILVVLEGGEAKTSVKEIVAEGQFAAQISTLQEPGTKTAASQTRVVATPATRKLARELNVDLDYILGTGPGGRVTEEDVRKTASAKKEVPLVAQIQVQKTASSQAEQRSSLQMPVTQVITTQGVAREERIPVHGIRKRIAEKMSKSVHTAAHVLHVDEVDFTELIALREAVKSVAEIRQVKVTYLPFLIKAAAYTLREFPYFNASIDDEKKEIVLKHYFNIGFATDTPNGLIVPVVKDADKKKILDIANEIENLAEQARNGTISLENIQGGTFTITNIGTLGGVFAAPIINHPEVAILGISKFEKRPVVRADQIVIRPMGYLSLSFDHRIVDGADAARFTTRLIKYLENPSTLFLESL